MKKHNSIPIPMLRKLMSLNPETGELMWLARGERNWDSKNAFKRAFTSINRTGYFHGKLLGKPFLAHRIVWALVHGEWPETIDHINGIRHDNRPSNLRSVSHRVNLMNQRPKNGREGVMGVGWDKQTNKWTARIGVMGKDIRLGYFEAREDAIAARVAAEIEYNFHPNHGKLAA